MDIGREPLWNGGVEIGAEENGGSYLGCGKMEAGWNGRDLPGGEVIGYYVDWNRKSKWFWSGVVEREVETIQSRKKMEKMKFGLLLTVGHCLVK